MSDLLILDMDCDKGCLDSSGTCYCYSDVIMVDRLTWDRRWDEVMGYILRHGGMHATNVSLILQGKGRYTEAQWMAMDRDNETAA